MAGGRESGGASGRARALFSALWFGALAACMGAGMGVGDAMGNRVGSGTGGGEITLACVAGNAKLRLPEGLCPVLAARLVAAYPGTEVRLAAGDAPATATLVVTQAGGRALAARLDWAGAPPGAPLAMARMDAPLDAAAFSGFLDDLIAQTPRP
ncbi:hypothetical protein [Pseudogemmobacter sonorensis]|uniref:hypothetical protein n=1 Tax=Pseudogemmobacter sonorensis TaxID=2989681 RepID=UPI0036A83FB1